MVQQLLEAIQSWIAGRTAEAVQSTAERNRVEEPPIAWEALRVEDPPIAWEALPFLEESAMLGLLGGYMLTPREEPRKRKKKDSTILIPS